MSNTMRIASFLPYWRRSLPLGISSTRADRQNARRSTLLRPLEQRVVSTQADMQPSQDMAARSANSGAVSHDVSPEHLRVARGDSSLNIADPHVPFLLFLLCPVCNSLSETLGAHRQFSSTDMRIRKSSNHLSHCINLGSA